MPHERWFDSGIQYQIVWAVNTVSSPEGATVIVVNFHKPIGKRIVNRAKGEDHELDRLLMEGKRAAHMDSMNRSEWPKPRKKSA